MSKRAQRLYDAGFTPDELESLATDLSLAVTLAEAGEYGHRFPGHVAMTEEKFKALKEFFDGSR